MPNPRRKLSRSKRDMRRAHWRSKLSTGSVSECSNCGEPKLPHRVCPNCGHYNGRAVYTPDSEA